MGKVRLFVHTLAKLSLTVILFFPLVAERPQHMLMRVAVGIHKEDIDAAIEVHITTFSIFIEI